jgi:hypothetical protein
MPRVAGRGAAAELQRKNTVKAINDKVPFCVYYRKDYNQRGVCVRAIDEDGRVQLHFARLERGSGVLIARVFTAMDLSSAWSWDVTEAKGDDPALKTYNDNPYGVSAAALRCAALRCTALHCTALHRTALHCTAALALALAPLTPPCPRRPRRPRCPRCPRRPVWIAQFPTQMIFDKPERGASLLKILGPEIRSGNRALDASLLPAAVDCPGGDLWQQWPFAEVNPLILKRRRAVAAGWKASKSQRRVPDVIDPIACVVNVRERSRSRERDCGGGAGVRERGRGAASVESQVQPLPPPQPIPSYAALAAWVAVSEPLKINFLGVPVPLPPPPPPECEMEGGSEHGPPVPAPPHASLGGLMVRAEAAEDADPLMILSWIACPGSPSTMFM